MPVRSVVALPDMWRLMTVIFTVQFVERSFGPILPLYLGSVAGVRENVALASGVLFSLTAGAGAVGNLLAPRWLARTSARHIIVRCCVAAAGGALVFALGPPLVVLGIASVAFGVAVGTAMTAAYTRAGGLIPAEARASGFAVVTSATLVGVAVSPMVAGAIARWSLSAVFVVDVVMLAAAARWVAARMEEQDGRPAREGRAPAGDDA
jgi:MFS family permease